MINVLTLNWKGVDKLKELQPGLIKNLEKTGLPWKWYIRDNQYSSESQKWLESQSGVIPLLVSHNRDNFSQGVNSLVQLMESDFSKEDSNVKKGDELYFDSYVLLLNNDVVFNDEESLSRMVEIFNKDQKNQIGIVGARLLYKNTNKLQHAGVIMSNRYGKMPFHYRHKEESDKDAEKNRYFQAVTAACCLIRHPLMVQYPTKGPLTPLCEDLNWSFDDIDFCLRVGKKDWKIAYCGETNIYHEESASLKINPLNKLYLNKNVKYFQKTWFGKYEIDHDKYLKDPNYNLIK